MALQFISVGQFTSYKRAATQARDWAMQTKVLHAVRREEGGGFQVFKSSKGRLGEFQKFAYQCGYSYANYDPETLRKLCLSLGLTPAGWRYIHWHGDSAYQAILQDSSEDYLLESVMNYVEWQAQAGLKTPLPKLLGHGCAIVFEQQFKSLLLCNPSLALVAMRHWELLPSVTAKEDFAHFQWTRVLEWMRDDSPKLDSNQYRSGWGTVWRAFQKSRNLSDNLLGWVSILGPIISGEYEALPLVTAFQVELEGEAMEHCVVDYVESCQLGEYRLFSVRQTGSQERIATVGLEYSGERWTLDQVKGLCNTAPSREVFVLATELAEMYQLAQEGGHKRNTKSTQHPLVNTSSLF